MKITKALAFTGILGILTSLISGCAQTAATSVVSTYTTNASETTKTIPAVTTNTSIIASPTHPSITTTSALPSSSVYPTVQIALQPDKAGINIPADFLGVSYEAPVLAGNYFDTNNNVYINLLHNLGEGVLRFGGNSVEFTYWSRTPGKTFPNSRAVLLPSDLDRLFAFANKTNWHVILGLNLGANNPTMAADEAAYAWQVGKNSITGFEVGNEPDLYARNGLRSTTYTYTDFHQEFTRYLQSIQVKIPNAPIAGPVTAYNYEWFSTFLKDEKNNVALSTQHLYPLSASSALKPTDASYATIDKLLSAAAAQRTINSIQQFENAAKANNLPLRYAETNSASSGGKDGVSNAFASALWGADYLFNLAENGVVGVNFHGGFSTHGYTPIGLDKNNQYTAMPLYYAMLLFHDAAQGRIIPLDMNTAANVTAHAVLGNDGTLHLVIINKDATEACNAQINPGKSYSRAGALRLTAPSLESQNGVTFGGSAVAPDGTWSGGEEETVTQNSTGYHIVVSAASAVAITFRE
jgi:hypothetical protein